MQSTCFHSHLSKWHMMVARLLGALDHFLRGYQAIVRNLEQAGYLVIVNVILEFVV